MPAGGRQVLAYSQWSHSGNKLLQQKVGAWSNSTPKINGQCCCYSHSKTGATGVEEYDMIWFGE